MDDLLKQLDNLPSDYETLSRAEYKRKPYKNSDGNYTYLPDIPPNSYYLPNTQFHIPSFLWWALFLLSLFLTYFTIINPIFALSGVAVFILYKFKYRV